MTFDKADAAFNARPLRDLRDTGLLWMINTVIFHPRGYALALMYECDGEPGPEDEPVGFTVLGDGKEVWVFGEEDADQCFAKFNEFLKALEDPGGS